MIDKQKKESCEINSKQITQIIGEILAQFNIEPLLIRYGGGLITQTLDDSSDIDIAVVVDCAIDIKNIHFTHGQRTYSLLFDKKDDGGLYARYLCHFIQDKDILYSTPNGLAQLNKYQAKSKKYAAEYLRVYRHLRLAYLNKNQFDKQLYHQLLCGEILTGEVVDREVLLGIKRNKQPELLQQYLIKIEDNFNLYGGVA